MSDSQSVMLRQRSIDIIIPDCAIEEHHRDRLSITNHPVEMGSPIADHAFKEPEEVSLRYGWSNSSQQNNIGSEFFILDIYQDLLKLQASAAPFDLITGKRLYHNMLIAELSVTTDETSEFALMTNIICRQVIIVTTATASLPDDKQAQPQKTSTPVKKGDTQLANFPPPSPPPPVDLPAGTPVPGSGTPSSGNLTPQQMFGGGGEPNDATAQQIFGGGGEPNDATAQQMYGGVQPGAGPAPLTPTQMYGGRGPTPPAPTTTIHTDIPTITVRPEPSTSFIDP